MRPRHPSHPYLLLLPTAALLALFFVVPVLFAVSRSFVAWDMLTPPRPVGFQNYRQLAASGELLRLLGRSLWFSAVVVSVSSALGLALALALSGPGRFRAFVRASVFSAYVVSWVSVALLFLWILDPDTGPLAKVAKALGAPSLALLTHPDRALTTLAFVTVWKITGFSMVCFLVGLEDIPRPLLEAAQLDGADAWARFRRIVWPMLRPTAAFVATTSLIASFQAFDVVRVMTQGGPVKATTLFVYAIYEQVFLDLRVGRASALTVVFFVLLLTLAGLQLRLLRPRERRA